jgi:flagellar biogenesis protein FliO
MLIPVAESTSGLSLLANALPAFLLVLGAPIGLWWWVRRSRQGATHRLRVTDKAALGKNTWVAVVEVDDKRLLLGAGENGIGLLSELDPVPDEQTAESAETVAHRAPDGDIAGATSRMNGLLDRPRMGLVRRLQLMTLRTSARPLTRPPSVPRR